VACILVVDDDEAIAMVLKEILTAEGYTVLTAGDGQDALSIVSQHPAVDLILLDHFMPLMDGPAFLAAYRQRPGPRAPVVALTTAIGGGEIVKDEGVVALLQKPFDVDQLLSAVKASLPIIDASKAAPTFLS
jgi:two-component system, sensor histidine kinase and response regulator